MDELTFDGQVYVSSKRAAQITGYAKDYVGQLCREGRVIARLVGRNWYVLESSIREHRFGVQEESEPEVTPIKDPVPEVAPENEENELQDSWQAANYLVDPSPELLPSLTPAISKSDENTDLYEAKEPILNEQKPKTSPISSSVVNEMQSAWHDWFTRTNELEVSEETLLTEHSEDFMGGNLHTQKDTNELEIGSEPVSLEKVTQVVDKLSQNEEIVPIKRIYRDTRQQAVRFEDRKPLESNYAIARKTEAEEGVIIRERKIIRKKKSTLLPKMVLVAIAIIAIFVTAAGSGVLQNYIAKYPSLNSRVQILNGTMVIK